MNLPPEFSMATSDREGVIAAGPFVIEATVDGDRVVDLGFEMMQLDAGGVAWFGFDHEHVVVPTAEPELINGRITFSTADGDQFSLRPVAFGDGALVGYDDPSVPATTEELKQSVEFLANYLWLGYMNQLDTYTPISENNVYVTRDSDGNPLALVKMSASHPTLLRQDGTWRALADDEDDLLGDSDSPAREEAVTAWDSGNLQSLERLLLDDRFSPSEVTSVWLEVGTSDELERLLIERSRGRVYERTHQARWISAQANSEAPTVGVRWGAVGAWDAGELRKLAQAQEYDVDGDTA